MALLSVIRRWRLRDGMAIREITRRTGLSRNTVRKYLSNGVTDPRYPERQSPSKLDGFADKLAAWLKTESHKGRKQRRNLSHNPAHPGGSKLSAIPGSDLGAIQHLCACFTRIFAQPAGLADCHVDRRAMNHLLVI